MFTTLPTSHRSLLFHEYTAVNTFHNTTGNGGIGLTLKNINTIMARGFVLRLHGVVIDWQSLKTELENRHLSPSQRSRLNNSQMDTEMKAYYTKVVAYIESGENHPGELLDQPFVHRRITGHHEVNVNRMYFLCIFILYAFITDFLYFCL